MIYVFVFLGEFGFELLNWQGVVRKFSETISSEDKIICCSRAKLYPLYERADEFIDISDVPLFKRSRAAMYRAIYTPVWIGRRQLYSYLCQKLLKVQLKRAIMHQSKILNQADTNAFKFVFSADTTRLNGCTFGPGEEEVDIYDLLDVENNIYKKIEPDLGRRDAIEMKLGWSLTEPYILVQGRKRDSRTKQLSDDILPEDWLIQSISERMNIILLTFNTGRWLDSYSSFTQLPTTSHQLPTTNYYLCQSFPEQSCLIHFAKHCLFLTEGDFGSHIYLPPFLGKDVIAIAPQSVYEIGSTPIALWNQNVFQFGGQVIPKISEHLFSPPATFKTFLHGLHT